MASNDSITSLRRCIYCKRELPATTEHFDMKDKLRLRGHCKACRREYANAYRKRENVQAKAKEVYQRDREKRLASGRKWRQENPDKFRASQQNRSDRTDYMREYSRKYNQRADVKAAMRLRVQKRRATPEGVESERNYRASERGRQSQKERKMRRRARLAGTFGTVTAADVRMQLESQKHTCWWCGESVGSDYHVDHIIPLARGGTNEPRNICISCPQCNLSKGSKMPSEWGGRLF